MPDPVSAGAGLIGGASPFGWASLGAGLLGGALKGGQPAGPSQAILDTQTNVGFDSSGWVVATSRSTAEGELSKTDAGQSKTTVPVSNGSMASMLPSLTTPTGGLSTTAIILIGLGVVILLRARK